MDQLGLQVRRPALGRLLARDVVDEADEDAAVADSRLADREFDGEGRAVLAAAEQRPALADDSGLAGAQITGDVGIVPCGVRFGHQQVDVTSDGFGGGPAEHAFGLGAETVHDSVLVHADHGVRNRVGDGPQPFDGVARPGFVLLRSGHRRAKAPFGRAANPAARDPCDPNTA